MATLQSFTAEKLQECWDNDQRRLELNREAAKLEKANKVVLADLQAALEAAEKRSIRRGDLVAELQESRERVKWAEEYLRECGAEKAAAAEAAAGTKQKIVLRKSV